MARLCGFSFLSGDDNCPKIAAIPLCFVTAQITEFTTVSTDHSYRNAHCISLLLPDEGSARDNLISPLSQGLQ